MKEPPKLLRFIAGRFKGLRYALQGLATFFGTQAAAWAHLIGHATLAAIAYLVGISTSQWLALILAILICWVTEMLNTAIEYTADALTTEHHPLLGKAKDLGAAAVCTSLVGEVVVFTIIIVTALGEQ